MYISPQFKNNNLELERWLLLSNLMSSIPSTHLAKTEAYTSKLPADL